MKIQSFPISWFWAFFAFFLFLHSVCSKYVCYLCVLLTCKTYVYYVYYYLCILRILLLMCITYIITYAYYLRLRRMCITYIITYVYYLCVRCMCITYMYYLCVLGMCIPYVYYVCVCMYDICILLLCMYVYYVCVRVCVFYMRVHMCVFVFLRACLFVCFCIFITFIHSHSQSVTWTNYLHNFSCKVIFYYQVTWSVHQKGWEVKRGSEYYNISMQMRGDNQDRLDENYKMAEGVGTFRWNSTCKEEKNVGPVQHQPETHLAIFHPYSTIELILVQWLPFQVPKGF